MPHRRDLSQALARGPVTPRAAAVLGVRRDVLRGKRFETPFHGVRLPAGAGTDLVQRCRALALLLPDAAFSHSTAAALLRLPDVGPPAGAIEVSLPRGARATRRPGVRGHTGLAERDVEVTSGLRVVRAARTWADLAARHDVGALVVLGDAALRSGLATGEGLAGAVLPGRRGCRRARTALGLLDARSDSPMESLLRVLLVTNGLPAPEVNRDVVVDGVWLARPDLSYPRLRIALEYEGDHHRTDRRQWLRDKARRRLLEDHGWVVLEVTSVDVLEQPGQLVARVRSLLARRQPG